MILTFSTGPPFRKPVFTNLGFVGIFITLFILTALILLLAGGWVEEVFELLPYPADGNFKWRLFGLCLGSGATSFLWEFLISQLAEYLTRKKREEHERQTKGLPRELARIPSGRRLPYSIGSRPISLCDGDRGGALAPPARMQSMSGAFVINLKACVRRG
jgi:hypothetical protein